MADFDKAARYQAKQDPPGLLAWLWNWPHMVLVFHSWLDARRLALPVEGDLTCDTVAGLAIPGKADIAGALILEFMVESRRETLEQLLDYVVRAWRESQAGGRPLALLGAAVINLTGPWQTTEMTLGLPDLPCELTFRILQRNLRDEDSAAALAAIQAGTTTRWLLPWVPLMQGGNESAIMEQWKTAASAEPEEQRRGILAALTLCFASLSKTTALWKRNLEGWNVQTSEFLDEIREETRLSTSRELLIALLENRFGRVPPELVQRIQGTTDLTKLKAALLGASSLDSLDKLLL